VPDDFRSAPRPGRAGPVVLALLVLAVIGGGWLIWANGGASKYAPSAGNRAPAAPRVAIDRIIRRVERLRGLHFKRPVKIKFATPADAASMFRAAAEREYSARQQRIDEEELKLIGLLAPSVNLDRVVRAIGEDEILGFYDTETKRLVVIRTSFASHALLETTFAHELAHALEDQRFGIEEPKNFNDDRGGAIQALFEGTATALEIDYAVRYLDFKDLGELLDDVAGADVKLPPFIERSLLFPYEEGAQFVDAFRERGNWRAINQVIRLRHPSSTEQIMHPELYAIDQRPANVEVSDLGNRLGGEWHRVDSTDLGEAELGFLFDLVGKTKGKRAAAGWDGGAFELWRREAPAGCKVPCVQADAALFRLGWDTVRDRTEAEKAFTRVFERGLKGTRIATGGVRVWSSRGGAIGLARKSLQTTVVFVPDRSLATKLLK
jgi:hypothetical protein